MNGAVEANVQRLITKRIQQMDVMVISTVKIMRRILYAATMVTFSSMMTTQDIAVVDAHNI